MPAGRSAEGKFLPGTSGNPGGLSADEAEKIIRARRAAQNRTLKAVRTLDRLMDDENGKVAATAALGILKVAGVFGDEAAIERKVEERLKQLIGEAQNQTPRLTSVGG